MKKARSCLTVRQLRAILLLKEVHEVLEALRAYGFFHALLFDSERRLFLIKKPDEIAAESALYIDSHSISSDM